MRCTYISPTQPHWRVTHMTGSTDRKAQTTQNHVVREGYASDTRRMEGATAFWVTRWHMTMSADLHMTCENWQMTPISGHACDTRPGRSNHIHTTLDVGAWHAKSHAWHIRHMPHVTHTSFATSAKNSFNILSVSVSKLQYSGSGENWQE